MQKRAKITLISMGVTLFLVGCSASGGPGYSKTNSYMKQGCLGGGVLGAIAGATLGSGDNAADGAVLGCAIGAYVGFRVAKRTDQYINSQQAIESEVARNQKNINGVKKSNNLLMKQIGKYEDLIQTVKKANMNEKIRQNDYKKIKNHLNETISKSSIDLNVLNEELSIAKTLYTKHKSSAKPKKSTHWAGKISNLEKEKSILSKHVQSLTALNASI